MMYCMPPLKRITSSNPDARSVTIIRLPMPSIPSPIYEHMSIREMWVHSSAKMMHDTMPMQSTASTLTPRMAKKITKRYGVMSHTLPV